MQTIIENVKNTLPYLYPIAATSEDTSEMVLSCLSFFGEDTDGIVVGATLGTLTAISSLLTYYYFYGQVIKKNLNRNNLAENSSDHEINEQQIQTISRRTSAYYLVKEMAFITSSLVVDYGRTCFYYGAIMAYIQSLKTGQEIDFVPISYWEGLAVALYYSLADIPLISLVEMPESIKEIRRSLNIHRDQAPDKNIWELLSACMRPIARPHYVRRSARIMSSLADTFEHVIPLFLFIPVSFALTLSDGPAALKWLVMAIAALVMVLLAVIVFAQTYLFEGKIMEKNLQTIAHGLNVDHQEDERWVPRKIAKIARPLLNIPIGLHGVSTGLSVLKAFQEMRVPDPYAYTIAFFFLGITCGGKYYSEGLESQQELDKITLIEPAEEIPMNRFGFFNNEYSGRTLPGFRSNHRLTLNHKYIIPVEKENEEAYSLNLST